MKDNYFFIINNLPNALSKKEQNRLFKEYSLGDNEARKKLILHNMKLIIYTITNNFNNTKIEMKDLVGIGIIGLIKAVDTYDLNKNFQFAPYAIRCINNEILMVIRKDKSIKDVSLELIISSQESGSELFLFNILENEKENPEEIYENKETILEIREIVDQLPQREKEIIKLYYGLDSNKIHTQEEISQILNISRSYVSRLLKKSLIDLKEKLESKEYGSKKI